VTRGFGDFNFNPYLTVDPYICEKPVDLACAENKFVILACDGVWEVVDDEAACALVSEALE
jgi:serine/threonine protein phosphatase PrpC